MPQVQVKLSEGNNPLPLDLSLEVDEKTSGEEFIRVAKEAIKKSLLDAGYKQSPCMELYLESMQFAYAGVEIKSSADPIKITGSGSTVIHQFYLPQNGGPFSYAKQLLEYEHRLDLSENDPAKMLTLTECAEMQRSLQELRSNIPQMVFKRLEYSFQTVEHRLARYQRILGYQGLGSDPAVLTEIEQELEARKDLLSIDNSPSDHLPRLIGDDLITYNIMTRCGVEALDNQTSGFVIPERKTGVPHEETLEEYEHRLLRRVAPLIGNMARENKDVNIFCLQEAPEYTDTDCIGKRFLNKTLETLREATGEEWCFVSQEGEPLSKCIFYKKNAYEVAESNTASLRVKIYSKQPPKEVFPVVLWHKTGGTRAIFNVHLEPGSLFANKDKQLDDFRVAANEAFVFDTEYDIVGDFNSPVGIGGGPDSIQLTLSNCTTFNPDGAVGVRMYGGGVDGGCSIDQQDNYSRKPEQLIDPTSGKVIRLDPEAKETPEIRKAKIHHPSYRAQWLEDLFLEPCCSKQRKELEKALKKDENVLSLELEVNHFNAHRLTLCTRMPVLAYEKLMEAKTPGLSSELRVHPSPDRMDGFQYHFTLEGEEKAEASLYESIPKASISLVEEARWMQNYSDECQMKLQYYQREIKKIEESLPALTAAIELMEKECVPTEKNLEQAIKNTVDLTGEELSSYVQGMLQKERLLQIHLLKPEISTLSENEKGNAIMDYCKSIEYTPLERSHYQKYKKSAIVMQLQDNPDFRQKFLAFKKATNQLRDYKTLERKTQAIQDMLHHELERVNQLLKEQFDIIHSACKKYDAHLKSAKKWAGINLPKKSGSLATKQTVMTEMVTTLDQLEKNASLPYADKLLAFHTNHQNDISKLGGRRDTGCAIVVKTITTAFLIALGISLVLAVPAYYAHKALWKVKGDHAMKEIQEATDKVIRPSPKAKQ